jgi:hypothetical protein
MSRFDDGDYDTDDYGELRMYGWENATNRAFNGKRGLVVLQEMERALLALPQPRLIANYVAHEGEVCAVGAFAKYKGVDLAEFEALDEDEADSNDTANLGIRAGMQRTIAWTLAHMNDEVCSRKTPEERFEYVLGYVRSMILQNPHHLSPVDA